VLIDLKIVDYLAKTASGDPVPGGGSSAALNAALGAALIEMVANLTIGRKGFETVDAEMRAVAANANILSHFQFLKKATTRTPRSSIVT